MYNTHLFENLVNSYNLFQAILIVYAKHFIFGLRNNFMKYLEFRIV